jgi:hypothetical protein
MAERKWVIDPDDDSAAHGVRLVNYNPDDVGRMVEIKPAERDALQAVIEGLGILLCRRDSPEATWLNINCYIAGKILGRYQASESPAEWKPKRR